MRTKLRHLPKQKYLVIDTETEGLNLAKSKTWQVSWLLTTTTQEISIENKHLWWDDLKVSEDAARITGFNYEKYRLLAQDPKAVWEKLEPLLFDPSVIVVGQNFLHFDIYMLNIWHRLLYGKPLDFHGLLDRVMDTKAMEMAIQNGADFNDSDEVATFMMRWINFRDRTIKTSQLVMVDRYSIPCDKSKLHDAEYDIRMTFEIFKKQIMLLSV
jgi:DNA polymerase III epsilon subunit-like protein